MTENDQLSALKKEVDSWRFNFLEKQFSDCFKHIPENYKKRISAYFLSIPSNTFTNPNREWDNCLSVLLQSVGEKK